MSDFKIKTDVPYPEGVVKRNKELEERTFNFAKRLINNKEQLITKAISMKDLEFAERLRREPLEESTKQEIKERMQIVEPSYSKQYPDDRKPECYELDGEKLITFYEPEFKQRGSKYKATMDYEIHAEEADNNA